MDTTADELEGTVTKITDGAATLLAILTTKGSKIDFMKGIDDIEAACTQLRADVIRHSRRFGAGVTRDGRPDRRFKANREGLNKPDLRLNK